MDYTTYIFKSTFISVYIKLFWIYQSSFASIRYVIQTKLHFWTVLLLWSPTAICNKKTRLVWMIFYFYKSVVSWQPQFPYWPILYYSVKINFFFNFCEILRFLTSFQYHYYNDFKIATNSSWDGYHLLQSV